jgi:hypothetical protein
MDLLPFLYFRKNRMVKWALTRIWESRVFRFQGKGYHYFVSDYNATVLNERAVEIPIIQRVLSQYGGKDILEIGNVLSHYFPADHTIIDKYESGRGVINEDICTFAPGRVFDLIISISTLEHVGYDENPRRPEQCIVALENIRNLLKPGGQAWITIPTGYNPFIEEYLKSGTIAFDESYGLKQVSRWNEWVECSVDEALQCPYGPPHAACATGIIIGILKK